MTLRCIHLGNNYSFTVSYAFADAIFREAVNEILSKYVGKTLNVPLSQLHTVDGFNNRITTMSGAQLNNLQDMWNKERDRKQSDLFHRFDEIYTDFMSNVIAPSLKGGMMLIIYQLTHSLTHSLTRSLTYLLTKDGLSSKELLRYECKFLQRHVSDRCIAT